MRGWAERCREILEEECQRQNAPDGGNREQAAYLSGVQTRRVILLAFMVSGAAAALAGVMLAGYSTKAYQGMGVAYVLPSIAAVVIGGTNILGGSGRYLGTLVGVEFQNRCVGGVCHFPALNETVWGARGLGAWWQPAGAESRPARVSSIASLSEALFCFTTVQGFARIGRQDAFEALISGCRLARGWGDCCSRRA